MVHPFDYVRFIQSTHERRILVKQCIEGREREQKIMARVALNSLVDPVQYPVDLAELERLTGDNKMMTLGFLAHCDACPEEYYAGSDERRRELDFILFGKPTGDET